MRYPRPLLAGQEFSDDDAHQAEADVDLHVADDGGDGTWQHHLDKGLQPAPPEGVDQLDLSPGPQWRKLAYRFKMLPKMATDMPATMMVVRLAPSQTIRRGARADLGRLFRTTR